MTYSERKIKAYKALDEAVAEIHAAYQEDHPDQESSDGYFLTGYVLLTNQSRPSEIVKSDLYADDLDMETVGAIYGMRGQNPVLTLGMMHDAVEHYNSLRKD